jgi:hypothetical protein
MNPSTKTNFLHLLSHHSSSEITHKSARIMGLHGDNRWVQKTNTNLTGEGKPLFLTEINGV